MAIVLEESFNIYVAVTDLLPLSGAAKKTSQVATSVPYAPDK